MAYTIKPSAAQDYQGTTLVSQGNLIGWAANMVGALTVRYTFKSSYRLGGFAAKISGKLNGNLDGRFRYAVSTSATYPNSWTKVAEENSDHLLIKYTGEIKANTTYYLFVSKEPAGLYAYYAGCSADNVTITGEVVESTLTATAGTLGTAQTLTINRADTAYTHTIKYTVGNVSGTIATKTSAVNVSWTPPLSLAEQNTTGKTLSCKLALTAYSGNAEMGTSETTITLTIPSSTSPSVSATYSPDNGSLDSKFAGIFVQGKSKVKASYTATPQYGAMVKSYTSTVDGKSASHSAASYTSEVLVKSGSVSVSVKATDSRGYSTTKSGNVSVEAYSAPAVIPVSGQSSIVCTRADSNGNPNSGGSYLLIRAGKRFSSVSGKNRCLLRYRYAKDGSSYSAWTTLLALGSSANSISTTLDLKLDAGETYSVEIGVADDIGESASILFSVPTESVPLHLGEGGKNVALGRRCDYDTENRIDVGWDMYLSTGVRIHPPAGEGSEVARALGAGRPYNLLDNSDLANPVNQRGATSYTADSAAYSIDRWQNTKGTLTVLDGYVNWKSAGTAAYKRIIQKHRKKFAAGKTYTLAMLARVNAVSGTANFRLANDTAAVSGATKQIKNTTDGFEWIVLSHTLMADIDIPGFDILVSNTANDHLDIDIKAAAIYEGEFTAETLPEYRPKGYGVELTECQRYFQRFKNSSASSNYPLTVGLAVSATRAFFTLDLPVPMRIYPTITASDLSLVVLSNDALQTSFEATSVSSAGGFGTDDKDFSQRSFSVVTSGLTAKQSYIVYVKGGGSVDFSADL